MDAPHQHKTFENLRTALEELRTKLLANQMEFANQVDGLHKAIESMVSEASAERQSAEALTRAAEERLTAFVTYLQNRDEQEGDGQSLAHELSDRVAELERKLAESEEKLAARQQQYADEAAAAEAARDRVAKLEGELAGKESEAEARVAALERSLAERTAEKEKALEEVAEARALLEEAQARAKAIEEAGAETQEEMAGLRGQLDRLVKDLEALKGEKAEKDEQIGALTQEKTALAETVASLEKSLAEAADTSALEEELEQVRRELQEQRVREHMLEQQVRDEMAKGTKSALAEQLAEALRDLDQAREELRVLRASRAREARPGFQWPEDPMARIRDAARRLEGSHRRAIGAILVDAGIVTEEQVESALEEQRSNPQTHMGAILVDRGYASEEAVGLALACQSQVDFVSLDDETVDPQAPALVNERLAQKHHCIPIQASVDTIVLAMANPLDLVAIEDVERATNRKAEVVVATRSAIDAALERYYWEPE